jgi:hypothetical protein
MKTIFFLPFFNSKNDLLRLEKKIQEVLYQHRPMEEVHIVLQPIQKIKTRIRTLSLFAVNLNFPLINKEQYNQKARYTIHKINMARHISNITCAIKIITFLG